MTKNSLTKNELKAKLELLCNLKKEISDNLHNLEQMLQNSESDLSPQEIYHALEVLTSEGYGVKRMKKAVDVFFSYLPEGEPHTADEEFEAFYNNLCTNIVEEDEKEM